MVTAAKPWAHLYDRRWRRRRERQLQGEPLCRFCARRGLVVVATVADHVVPHRGNALLFDGELQSLCQTCHNGAKQQAEKSGTVRGSDVNGMPLDPNHAWHREPQR